jgi:hypothetical protein
MEDLRTIQKLKDEQFSLREIETVMRLHRTSHWVEPSAVNEFSLLLKSKRSELVAQQVRLQTSIGIIDQELDRLSNRHTGERTDTGIPLSALSYLYCPQCRRPMQVEQAHLSNRFVHAGQLTCECGYAALINDGIVDTGNRYTHPYDSPDLDRDLYRTLCSDLLRIYQKCSGYIRERLDTFKLTGKVVFEANVNGYFFLYNHFRTLPKDCLYVVADKYPETLFMYKKLIEQLGLDLDILYIADATNNYPLKPGCIDICIDFFSTTEHQFYHEDTLVRAIEPFLDERSTLIGSYIELDSKAVSRKKIKEKYPESSRNAYTFSVFLNEMKRLGYEVASDKVGALTKTQDRFSFSCHVDGEEMRFYTFSARRA